MNIRYRIISPCPGCGHSITCTDRDRIRETVWKMHITSPEKGHLGGGTIIHECDNAYYPTSVMDEKSHKNSNVNLQNNTLPANTQPCNGVDKCNEHKFIEEEEYSDSE